MKGIVSGAKGIKWSKNSRKKLSNSKKNVNLSKEEHREKLSKKIYEYDLCENFIKEHISVSQAAESVGSLHTNLIRAMKKDKPFKNKIFKYEKSN